MKMKIAVEFSIKNVTLYPDRARVTCQGVVQVTPEVKVLVFDELPLQLEIDSLRVKGKGQAKVRILGVEAKIHHYERTPSQKVQEVETLLEQLHDEKFSLEEQNNIWEAQIKHLQGLRSATEEYAKGLSRGRSTVEDQARLIQFFREQDEEVRSSQQEIRLKLRDLERQIFKLESELNELRSTQPRQRFQAQMNIEVSEGGDFWPELVYVVGKAGWKPIYDVRLIEQEEGQELQISAMAQISQQTGQEWKDIQLSVSTARPALNQRLPELNPWFIDEFHAPPPRREMMRAAGPEPAMSVLAAPAMDSAKFEMQEKDYIQADVAQANIHDSGASIRFDIAGLWYVPSDGSPHNMVLTSFSQDPKINYLAIPKHTDAVYRRVSIINSSGGPLLEGSAALFVGDEFVGKTQVKYTPVEGEFKLLMGVEEQIVIKRELAKRAVDKRLLRENRIIRYAYKIEVKNLLPSKITLELQDQIPVSKHEQIKVKLERAQPDPGQISDLNLITWDLSLDSWDELIINHEYIVEYPSSMNVIGLKD